MNNHTNQMDRDSLDMYTIRKARLEDASTVVEARLELLRATRPDGFQFPPDFEDMTKEYVLRESQHGKMHFWVANDVKGQWIGVISLLLWSRPPLPEDGRMIEACVVNAYVKPEYRRKGIGSRLLSECLTSAEEFKILRFVLRTTDDGLSLYTSKGFVLNSSLMECDVG